MAYRMIRLRKIAAHRRWMIRNFALTYAAVTLRLEMPLLGMAFGDVLGYQLVAWVCWIPNLLVAEAIVRGWLRRTRAPIVIHKQPVSQD
jgi:hypothetical protein